METLSDEKIGQNLNTLRGDTPQSEVASYMRLQGFKWSQNTVWQVETGARPLRMREALALAEYFHTSLSRFVTEPEELKLGNFVSESFSAVQKSYQKFVEATKDLLTARLDFWTDQPTNGELSEKEKKEIHRLRKKKIMQFRTLAIWYGLEEAVKQVGEDRPELAVSPVHLHKPATTEEITGVKLADLNDPLENYFTYISQEDISKLNETNAAYYLLTNQVPSLTDSTDNIPEEE